MSEDWYLVSDLISIVLLVLIVAFYVALAAGTLFLVLGPLFFKRDR